VRIGRPFEALVQVRVIRGERRVEDLDRPAAGVPGALLAVALDLSDRLGAEAEVRSVSAWSKLKPTNGGAVRASAQKSPPLRRWPSNTGSAIPRTRSTWAQAILPSSMASSS
jgi:hypothetical protein